MARHIRKPKGQRNWIAFIRVPDDVRHIIGKTQLKKSLKTGDEKEAMRRAIPVVAQWEALFDKARTSPAVSLAEKLDELKRVYADVKAAEAAAHTDESWLDLQESLGGLESEIEELVRKASATEDTAAMAYKLITGELLLIPEILPEYLEVTPGTTATKAAKKLAIERFSPAVDNIAQNISRRAVLDYARGLQSSGLGVTTVRRHMAFLSGFWMFLRDDNGLFGDQGNPFSRVPLRDGRSRAEARKAARRAFTHEELQRLSAALQSRSNDPSWRQVYHLFLVAVHSGMRIEEIARLKTSDVEDNCFSIREAKSSAGIRKVPIHGDIRAVVSELVSNATAEGFLFDTPESAGRRGLRMGSMFSQLKTELGFGPELTFHSLRKSFASELEAMAVPEITAARLLGHEVKSLSYGIYSSGTPLRQLREAVDRLKFGLF